MIFFSMSVLMAIIIDGRSSLRCFLESQFILCLGLAMHVGIFSLIKTVVGFIVDESLTTCLANHQPVSLLLPAVSGLQLTSRALL
jgi:hypothetical protein